MSNSIIEDAKLVATATAWKSVDDRKVEVNAAEWDAAVRVARHHLGPLARYFEIVREIRSLDEEGKNDSDEAEVLRDESDVIWKTLTEEQRDIGRGYAASLDVP